MAIDHETFLSIGGTDYQALLRQYSFPLNYEELDNSVMGTGVPTVELGIFNATLTATLKFSEALGVALANAYAGSRALAVEIRRNRSAASSLNYKLTFTGALEKHNAIAGEVGQLHEMEVTIRTNSDVTYAEA